MRHQVTNLGDSPFQFMWGLHPAWAVTPNHRIDLPPAEVFIEESLPGARLGERGTRYAWPYASDRHTGAAVDMRKVLGPEARTSEFHFAQPIDGGWFAITDTEARVGVGMTFPREVFPVIWLWLGYGAWREYYVAAVEAWNAYPQKLVDAVREGVYGTLPPRGKVTAETQTGRVRGRRRRGGDLAWRPCHARGRANKEDSMKPRVVLVPFGDRYYPREWLDRVIEPSVRLVAGLDCELVTTPPVIVFDDVRDRRPPGRGDPG